MSSLLPESIIWRKDKVSFEVPQKHWMKHPGMRELVMESRRLLVKEGILKVGVLHKSPHQHDVGAAGDFDWRYLCAAHCI